MFTGIRLLSVTILLVALTACGGDDGPSTVDLSVACSGDFCGAVDAHTYKGEGVGVWRRVNDSDRAVEVRVSLSGLEDSSLRLVYTNIGKAPVAMPRLPLEADETTSAVLRLHDQPAVSEREFCPSVRNFPAAIEALRRSSASPASRTALKRAVKAADAPIIGDSRTWFVPVDFVRELRQAQFVLKHQAIATDGRVINLWVEESEYGGQKITDAVLDELIYMTVRKGPNSIYALVTGLTGRQPWGPHSEEGLIDPDQPLNIVLASFLKEVGGFFNPQDLFIVDPDDEFTEHSNEMLALFVNSYNFYTDSPNAGKLRMFSALSHELLHAINFYFRWVKRDDDRRFSGILEEMMALMMQDITDYRLTDGAFNEARCRFPTWLASSHYNNDFIDRKALDGWSYVGASNLGAYLLRQHGLDFYMTLFGDLSQVDDRTRLDNAIRQAGGTGYRDSLQRWGSLLTLLPSPGSPAGYGLPERVEKGFTLPALSGPDYVDHLKLPTTVPETLLTDSHFVFIRKPVNGKHNEVFILPPHTALTVVAQRNG